MATSKLKPSDLTVGRMNTTWTGMTYADTEIINIEDDKVTVKLFNYRNSPKGHKIIYVTKREYCGMYKAKYNPNKV